MTTLVLSSRHSEDNQALWRAAIRRPWSVVRVRGITLPPLTDDDIVLYVEALLAPTIAAGLSHRLLSPADDWLPSLPDAHAAHDPTDDAGSSADIDNPAVCEASQ